MDCRTIDCKVVIRDGSIISLAPNHFGIGERKDHYYGKVIQLIENQNSARVKFSLKIIFSFRGNSTPQSS